MPYRALLFRLPSRVWLLLVALNLLGSQGTSAYGAGRSSDQSGAELVRFVLAGDSTVTDNAGWGTGFAQLLSERAECTNLAKSGRSSRSFRSEGWWDKCIAAKPDYLLIQFGHNDQPGKGPDRESEADAAFRDHLRQYVEDARAAGIQPVLITPLTRRRWNSNGTINPSLAEYAAATSIVAEAETVPLIDLHRLSIAQCEEFGPTAFRAFEPMTASGADHTHLNRDGSIAVGQLVARELVSVLPQLADCFTFDSIPASAAPGPHDRELRIGGLQLNETDDAIAIAHNDRPLLTYVKVSPAVPEGMNPAYHRSGVLHPLTSPAGRTVTAMFPTDHPHQDGVFSAWVKTTWNGRDIDFWNLAGGTGRVLHQRVVSTFREDNSLGFEVDLVHRAEQSPVVDVLRERWRITARPTDGSFHAFDLLTTQQALTDLPLQIHEYHYGGIALRGPVAWLSAAGRDQQSGETEGSAPRIINNLGSDRIEGNHQHANWVAMTGIVEGGPVTIAVLCDANNFRAPQAARLHPTKPYFVFSPCVDGDFVIDRDTPYVARYRYLLTDAKPDPNWLNRQWESWQKNISDDGDSR